MILGGIYFINFREKSDLIPIMKDLVIYIWKERNKEMNKVEMKEKEKESYSEKGFIYIYIYIYIYLL